MSAFKALLSKISPAPKLIGGIENYNVRTLKSTLRVKWVRPERLPKFHPTISGDRSGVIKFAPNALMDFFEDSKELQTANENVRKLFQLNMNQKFARLQKTCRTMASLVRRHKYDAGSHEVYIAHLTAKIRFLKDHYENNSWDYWAQKKLINLVDKRKKQLKHLRRWDYPRFEWVLEKLDLEFKPYPNTYDKVTRKGSLRQLTTIYCEDMKEEKIAEYKKKMDETKVPFLEKKLDRLRWIKQQEEQFKLPPTVKDEDLAEVENLLAKLRLEVPNLQKKRYRRVIHPYTLEKYDPEEILAAEGKLPSPDGPPAKM